MSLNQQRHKESMKYLTTAPLRENNAKFISAISDIAYESLTTDEAVLIERLYFKLKNLALRNQILYGLIRCKELELKDFFQNAYKKERYLDMRLLAVHGLAYYASEDRAGWIGGNAPEFFDGQSDLIHEGNQKYIFYLSLIHPFKPESMISIFIPEDYEEYLENNIYPNCSIKAIEHPISTESTEAMFTNPGLIKHAISGGELSNDEKSMDQSFLIKVGGNPRLIQNEDYYLTKLKEESISFLFQVDEEGYPETLLQEDCNYPFGFGSLYIYAKMGTTEVQHPVAGFWQFS